MIKKYLRNCKRLFPVYGKRERQFIKRLRDRIQEHIDSSPNLTYEELLEQFGSHFVLLYKSYRDVQDSITIHEETIIRELPAE